MSRTIAHPLLAVTLVLVIGAHVSAADLYQITHRVPLGLPDRWDYIVADPADQRVYVAHGDRVTVVDDRQLTILGEVTGLPGGTHGVAVDHAVDRGYTVDGRAGQAASFNLTTFAIEHRLSADDDADAVAFDPASGHVFVVDGDPGVLTVIDPKTDAVIARPKLGSALEYAVSGNNGKLYVNSMEKHEIVRLDTQTNQVDAHWPMPACERPHGLAIDTVTHRLFSGCSNATLTVVDATTGAVLANVPIGRGSDGVAFDPKRHRIFSANGVDGTLSVIEEQGDQFKPLATIPTQTSARTIGINADTGRIYLVAAQIKSEPAESAPAAAEPGSGPGPAPGPGPSRPRPNFVAGSTTLLVLDPQ